MDSVLHFLRFIYAKLHKIISWIAGWNGIVYAGCSVFGSVGRSPHKMFSRARNGQLLLGHGSRNIERNAQKHTKL